MPGTTTNGLPYPLNHEPMADVADAIKALAESLDGVAAAGAFTPTRGKAKRSAAQSLTAATTTLVALNATDWLVGGVTLSGSGLVVPAGAGGLYDIKALATWEENNGANSRALQVRVNGTDVPGARNAFRPTSITESGASVGVELVLAAADVVTITARQDTTGALSLTAASLSIRRVA